MFATIVLSLAYIYMGGHHDFGPFGGGTTLHLGSGEESAVRVEWTLREATSLSALMTSPLNRHGENGVGFTLTDSLSGGKLDLLLVKQPCGDDIYSTERLYLREVRDGVITDISLGTLPEEYASASGAAFTLSVMPEADGKAEVSLRCGESGSHEVWSCPWTLTPGAAGRIGFISAPGAQLTVSRAVLIYPESKGEVPLFGQEDIMRRIQSAEEPYTGLWCVLDHSLDSNLVRPGGNYMLAFVPCADGGYDMLYMEGATVNAGDWTTGMLKGHLKPTRMAGLYHARWLDAESGDIDGQALLQFTGTDLCVLTLPSLGSTIRLHRVPAE